MRFFSFSNGSSTKSHSYNGNGFSNGLSNPRSSAPPKKKTNDSSVSLEPKIQAPPPKKKSAMEDNIAKLKGMTNDFFSDM